jgi:hypothetical protein
MRKCINDKGHAAPLPSMLYCSCEAGATEYACFPLLLKQLVGPLSLQLADRRSSIVKQACHLLNLLSKELQNDFDTFAESFIPMLFKLVVITVLVIAESADTCIKTVGFSGQPLAFPAETIHILLSCSMQNDFKLHFASNIRNSLQICLADAQEFQSGPGSSSNN